MGSSGIINVPSPPSSSSSSPLARIHPTANEGEVETEISDLNRPSQGLGHEVSRLIFDNVENNKKLMNLKRRIEEFSQGENQLNLEIEQLERKVLMFMVEKGLKDDDLENFREENEIEGCEVLKDMESDQKFLDLMLEMGENDDKFANLGFGMEETKKCEKGEVFKELGTDLARQEVNFRQLVSDKNELAEKFEKMGNVVDEVVNVSDDGDEEEEEGEEIGEIEARELCKEIELLEAMLERGSFGLLDLQMMIEEVEALKGPEKMMSEMEVKMGELESGLWELKSAIVELKGKKSKELMDWVTKEEEKELECNGQEKVNARKVNWGSIIASVGAVVVVVAAVVFMGRTRVEVKAERRNKRETG
ncbi:hypothetical protein REPUB_Repub13aG0220900 [Reevesia pubescens]